MRATNPLAELLSIQAKYFLCVLYGETSSDFYLLDDDSLMHMLDGHFQILDTNDYVAKLQAAYMTTTEQVDIQKTQLYAHFLKNIFCKNHRLRRGHSKMDKYNLYQWV